MTATQPFWATLLAKFDHTAFARFSSWGIWAVQKVQEADFLWLLSRALCFQTLVCLGPEPRWQTAVNQKQATTLLPTLQWGWLLMTLQMEVEIYIYCHPDITSDPAASNIGSDSSYFCDYAFEFTISNFYHHQQSTEQRQQQLARGFCWGLASILLSLARSNPLRVLVAL